MSFNNLSVSLMTYNCPMDGYTALLSKTIIEQRSNWKLETCNVPDLQNEKIIKS